MSLNPWLKFVKLLCIERCGMSANETTLYPNNNIQRLTIIGISLIKIMQMTTNYLAVLLPQSCPPFF